MNEEELIRKLRGIEALWAGATSDGERSAAESARLRIRARLREVQAVATRELKFHHPDIWSRRLFVALLRRYGIEPYRYKRQRRTTVMARVQPDFFRETLWPEFRELQFLLLDWLGEVTDRVIREAVCEDLSEAGVVQEALP